MNSHDTTLTTKQERGIILTKGSVFMKKLKKWQKIVIGVLVALIVVIGGLKIFKRPILSAVLNDEEYIVYDCCCKMRRIIKQTDFHIGDFDLIYYTGYDSISADRIGVFVYSIGKNEAASCYAEYQDDAIFFRPALYNIGKQNVPDGYFVSWDIINVKTDKYKVLDDAVDIYNGEVVIRSGSLQDSNVTYDGEEREMIESSFEEYREIRGLKHWIINLYSY